MEWEQDAMGSPFAECGVKSLVAVFGGAPDLVLDGAVDVVLGVRLDDEETRILGRHVEILRSVVVLGVQFIDDRSVNG